MTDILTEGLAALGLPTAAAPRLAAFAAAVLEQNKVMNLTAITDPADFAALHLLDSVSLLTLADLRGKSVIDVGTGAGFPGVPLALTEPDMDLTLLDSLGKRVDFLRRACAELELPRVQAVHARAEEFASGHRERYDVAVSRAVAALNVLCELCLPLVKVGGVFLAMKSMGTDEELAAARGAISRLGGRVRSVQDYTVPGTQVIHRLITVEKIHRTPSGYPRPFARIKKQPLA